MVSIDDIVSEGQSFLIIEAMKTEILVATNVARKVLKLFNKNGDIIDSGDIVVAIECLS